jgi:uncharacterized repeat protein (TIGR01451 family)
MLNRRSLFAVLIAMLAFAGPAAAQVVFDAASNATPATGSNANPVLVNWNHTVGLAKKAAIVVSVSLDLSGGAATVGTVTYGSEAGGSAQAMTFLGAATNGTAVRAELWGLANPTPGTHQITVSVTNGGGQTIGVIAGAKSFTNVLLTTAGTVATATGTSLTPTTAALTNGVMDYVVDAVAFNNNVALTAGASQTNAYNLTRTGPNCSGGGSAKTGFVNTTMSWTATGTNQAWAIAAVPLVPAVPQVLFDDVSNTTFTGAATTFSGSWNHTTTTAANRYLVVGVSIDVTNNTASASSVTYGTEVGGPAQAMTLLGSITNGTSVRTELWGLVNPASGTHQITVNMTAANNNGRTVVAGSQSFSGVDQSAPVGTVANATGNSATPTVAVTNTAFDYVVDAVAFNGNTAQVEGALQAKRYAVNTATLTNFAGAGSGAHGYANVTMNWSNATATNQNWAISAVPLHPVRVAITKTASADVIKLADTVTYTIQVTNYTNATVNAVTITDAIPAGSNFVSQTGCAGTGPVTCNIGSLAAGATSSPITMTVLPTAAGSITNTASVTWTGAATANNSEPIRTLAEQKICATPGKDGAGGTLAGIKNDYWPGTGSPAVGATTLTVGARTAGAAGNSITAGDLLIVIQMQDAAFDTTNDETYGEGTGSTKATGTGSGASTSLNNAGRWEYVVATNTIGAAGGALTFNGGGTSGGLLYNYTAQTFAATTTQGQRTYQVIRVPQYTIATLGSTLTALPWNGATGGVLAVDVSGTLTLGGATVSVNGLGFRGGAGRVLAGDATAGLAATDFRTLATQTTNGSKGEGVAGTPRYIYQSGATIGTPGTNTPLDTGVEGYVDGSYGRGAPGNAGGGSTDGDPTNNGDNSGGGGGANAGAGGAGGHSWNSNLNSGGQGGGTISPSLTRITLGGGGGAGTSNNGSAADATGTVLADSGGPNAAGANGYYSSGANGGGIMIIRAMQATGSATLTANGFNAQNVGRDGSGGGGAGGSVLFSTQLGGLTGLTVQARGGNGGSSWKLQAPGVSPGERHGPGGGGGGGYVLLSSAAASTDISAGTNGTTTTSNDAYGAQPGTVGTVQLITGNNVLPGGDGASCIITDLAVTNVAPATVVAGNNVTYTQSVKNLGAFTADGVVYMAPIPASATFTSISVPAGWTCITPAVGGTGVVTCTTPTLASGATANFSLVVTTSPGTPAGYVLSETNSVSSNTPDSNSANNQATALTNVVAAGTADMAVTISQSTSVPTAGNNITYTQTVANLGNSTAVSPTYTMNIPANTTFVSMGAPPAGWTCITPGVGGTGTISCSAASLAAGTTLTWPSVVVKVNAGATAGTTITATPSVSSSTTDPYLPNNTASVTATVVAAGSGDVGISISSTPNPLSPAENYSYTAVAVNNGPAAAANVSVVIPVPAGANFRSLTPPAGWSCSTPAVGSSGNITCTIASLAAGASATFTPQVQVNTTTASGTTLNVTATISTTSTDSIAANNSASTSNLVTARTNADVAIVKTDSPDPIAVGQFFTYRLAVTNNGPATATNVTISDTLPVQVTFVSVNTSIGSCSGTTTISCSLGTLPVGNTQYVNIIVQANTTGSVVNTATASRTETDPVATNNSSSATTTVLAVTLVRLRTMTAVEDQKKVLLKWETTFESDNLGFNVFRDQGGVRTKINKGLIAGSALVSKKQDQNAGHSYRFRDTLDTPFAFVQYWLEDVDLHGVHTMHGPVSPTFGDAETPVNSPALAGLGQSGTVLASPAGYGVVRDLAIGDVTKDQTKTQRDIANDVTLKIFVTEEGWQRVTRAAMVAAGFDPGTKSSKLSLYCAGIEQPITVNDGGDDKFDAADDSIEFYGLPMDTRSTGARTYWLRAQDNSKRVKLSKLKGGSPLTGSVSFTYQRRDRNVFLAAITDVEENFFGPPVTSDWATTVDLTLGNVDTSWGGNGSLQVTVQGLVDNMMHMIDISLRGQPIGTVTLPNQAQQTFTFAVPQSLLADGINTLSLQARNGPDDISFLVGAKLTYQHLLRADNGALQVSLPGNRSVSVGGFADQNVRAIDVTDPQRPDELETAVAADPAGGFAATFTTENDTATRTVLVFDSTRRVTPNEIVVNRPSAWSASNYKGADLVVVTNPAFLSAASTIAPARAAQGISTAIVDVDDVYDEFNFGIRDPQAIRAFMQNAAQQWKTVPRWLMLVGDASMDPRNYLEMTSADYMPTKLVSTTPLMAAMDDWFTDYNNDGLPDVPVGRIPVRTADEASRIFGRLTSRGTPSGTWANSALFVADVSDDYDFAGAAAAANALLPSSITSQTVGPDHGSIVSALNGGQLLVDYIGHGSVEIWSNPGVFNSGDAAAMGNSNRLPFVVGMTCLNGYFHDLFTESMAEAMMKAPNGGAIAVWTSSSLTQPDQQSIMNRELFRQLFGTPGITLGEAVMRAKAAATDPDVRRSWVLFGDPSMRLK